MSALGLEAGRGLAVVAPQLAANLAAELRNAATPAACVAQELDEVDDEIQSYGPGIRDTVRHLLAIADALQGRPSRTADCRPRMVVSPILKASLEEGLLREAGLRDEAIGAYAALSDKSTEYAKSIGILIDVHNRAACVYLDALRRVAWVA